MNQSLIAACLITFAVLFAAFIITMERIMDRKDRK